MMASGDDMTLRGGGGGGLVQTPCHLAGSRHGFCNFGR